MPSAPTAATGGFYSDDTGGGDKYNVYPILVIGDGSFTTIGFSVKKGKGTKWSIINKMPGKETADINDPYGEIGFSSIKWWYGTMLLRPERIGLLPTLAYM